MPVLIASLEDPTFDARTSACLPGYDLNKHEFSLNRPIGDDWGQYIRHSPQPPPLLVRVEGKTIFVVFAALIDAQRFDQWLRDAAAEQQHGFNTMRG
jgi:hypothetical protein